VSRVARPARASDDLPTPLGPMMSRKALPDFTLLAHTRQKLARGRYGAEDRRKVRSTYGETTTWLG
jgi:hypothetical protein